MLIECYHRHHLIHVILAHTAVLQIEIKQCHCTVQKKL